MSQEKADALVGRFKDRLSPYVNAMKSRGYFGEAVKLQQQQMAQGGSNTNQPQQSQAGQQQQKAPQGQQPRQPSAGLGNAAKGLMDPSHKSGGNGIDGDYLSINTDVKPDSTNTTSAAANKKEETLT